MKQSFFILLLSFSVIIFANTIEKEAKDGNPQAQYLYAKSILDKNPKEANKFFLIAVFQDHQESAQHLVKNDLIIFSEFINQSNTSAILKENTKLIPKETLKKIRDQGNQGNLEMQYLMWSLYVNDRGVSKAEAYTWLKQAAGNNNPQALFRLGLLYYYGYIVPLERDKGIKLIKQASEIGLELASIFLKRSK